MAGLIRRASLAFFSLFQEFLQGLADETQDKKERHPYVYDARGIYENCRNAEVRTEQAEKSHSSSMLFVVCRADRPRGIIHTKLA